MTKQDWLITATPPTPNGDLHVGHMSGPYLAADIFKRTRETLGDSAVYVCYGDDNQSYVVTTAARLGRDPVELADEGNADIKKTLDAYRIDVDEYARPNADHSKAVSALIDRLLGRDLLVERRVVQLIDRQTGKPIYEAFATGICNICHLETKGGICESCGHPNDPVDLLKMPEAGSSDNELMQREVTRLVLPVEDYRDDLVRFYRGVRGKWRPHLIQLVDELLQKPLADYPILHPGDFGIPINAPKWEGNVINVWVEMGLGLVHQLGRHRSQAEIANGHYVQFLGYDNSYFFAIVHPVLQFALKRSGLPTICLPDYIFTNEFLNLESEKFSTSKGHAIWGRELLEHVSPDEARFYLSLHSPELSEANFQLETAIRYATNKIRRPMENFIVKAEALGIPRSDTQGQSMPTYVADLNARIRFYSEPDNFSSQRLATILQNLLKTYFLDPDNCSDERFRDLSPTILRLIGVFMPDYFQQIQPFTHPQSKRPMHA